jgi:hypothetical protein
MNSRGRPPILRGGPPLWTISMDHTVSCFALSIINEEILTQVL